MKINLANEISALEVWRTERHLSIESQYDGLKGNFFEEVSEFYRADDDNGKVDALCDMIVFIINASININLYPRKDFDVMDLGYADVAKECDFHLKNAIITFVSGDYRLPIFYLLSAIHALGYDPKKCLAETIKEISSRTGKYNSELKKFVKDKGAYCEQYVKDLLDFDSTIESYEITENVMHFVADVVYANGARNSIKYVKWYSADYSKCKR